MIRAVVDTNVLVSALLSPDGNPAKILSLVMNNQILLYFDSSIMHEYEEVLSREKFPFTSEDISTLIHTILQLGISAISIPSKIHFNDEKDRKFFDLAKSSGAYLITGNIKHYPGKSFVVTPREFIEIIWKV